MRKFLAALGITAAIIVAPSLPTPLAAAAYPCPYGWVLFGEFQTVPNLTPPCRLDLGMYNGTYQGLTVVQRCANKGGYLVTVQGTKVCRDVDY